MPRNQEVIRQWKVLHALESSRHGVTIAALADELGVTTRTIRRDLAALQEAGFPLFDEHDEEGRVSWRLDGQLFKGLEAGFTLPELCALYLGRNLLEAVGAMSFQRDLTLAFTRIEKLLTPRMRQFLDRLPGVLAAKSGPRTAASSSSSDVVAKLLEATLHYRASTMRYHSVSSAVERDYLVHPYRLTFAHGGTVPACLRAGLQGRSHVRRRPYQSRLAREADVRAEGTNRRRGLCQFTRREHRTRRARRARIRNPRGTRTSAHACGIRRSNCARAPTARSCFR